jgi:hypothetical protein
MRISINRSIASATGTRAVPPSWVASLPADAHMCPI